MPEATGIIRELTIRWRGRTEASNSLENHHHDFIRCQKHRHASVTVIRYLHGADPKGDMWHNNYFWAQEDGEITLEFLIYMRVIKKQVHLPARDLGGTQLQGKP